jgi:hypothetical protein
MRSSLAHRRPRKRCPPCIRTRDISTGVGSQRRDPHGGSAHRNARRAGACASQPGSPARHTPPVEKWAYFWRERSERCHPLCTEAAPRQPRSQSRSQPNAVQRSARRDAESGWRPGHSSPDSSQVLECVQKLSESHSKNQAWPESGAANAGRDDSFKYLHSSRSPCGALPPQCADLSRKARGVAFRMNRCVWRPP